jgi:putative membrane protein insertion efficiency factor
MNRIARAILVGIVLLYRATLRPVMGYHCRFDPTCSQYMLDAIAKHGPWRGGWRGLKRIARCHPWGGHGYDPA